jgi:hypothetical protein
MPPAQLSGEPLPGASYGRSSVVQGRVQTGKAKGARVPCTRAPSAGCCPFRGLADQRNSGDRLLRGGVRRNREPAHPQLPTTHGTRSGHGRLIPYQCAVPPGYLTRLQSFSELPCGCRQVVFGRCRQLSKYQPFITFQSAPPPTLNGGGPAQFTDCGLFPGRRTGRQSGYS